MSKHIIEQVVDQMNALPAHMQLKVLGFVTALHAKNNTGVRANTLLALASTLSAEDADLMREAIEAGCERIDKDTW